MRVFLSYHSADRSHQEALRAALVALRPSWDVYMDVERLVNGARWMPELAREIAKREVFILLVGKHIGPWQEIEYCEAFNLNVTSKGTNPRIIPIITDKDAAQFPFLGQVHSIFALGGAKLAETIISSVENGSQEGTPVWRLVNPYKGLPAFRSLDSVFFHGREAETRSLVASIAEKPNHAHVLVGSSGVGKSSLVQAGLVPALRHQFFPGDSGAVWPAQLSESRSWLFLEMRPSRGKPFAEVIEALIAFYEPDGSVRQKVAQGWRENFERGASLEDVFRSIRLEMSRRFGAEFRSCLLLNVNQAEEMFSLVDQGEADLFLRLLTEAAAHPDVRLVLSLRADQYGNYQATRELFERSVRHDVLPLREAGLELAVRRPAEQLGVSFEPRLAEKLVETALGRPGALPLLADTLHTMWEAMRKRPNNPVLTWADAGSLDLGAPLRERAEDFITKRPMELAAIRRLLTLGLIRLPHDAPPVRRILLEQDADPAIWKLATQLAEPELRLVTLGHSPAGRSAELVHEALLTGWPTLSNWIEEQREFLVWKERLAQDRAEWAAQPLGMQDVALLQGLRLSTARGYIQTRAADLTPDEAAFIRLSADAADRLSRAQREEELRIEAEKRRRARREKRLIISAFGVVTVILLGAWGYSASQARIADAQRKSAERDFAGAERTIGSARQTFNLIMQELAVIADESGMDPVMTARFLQRLRDQTVGPARDLLIENIQTELDQGLVAAAARGSLTSVMALLDAGANLRGVSEEFAAVHLAALNGHLEILKFLIDRGASATVSLRNGWQPIHFAAANAQELILRFLIDLGASVDAATRDGFTALHLLGGIQERERNAFLTMLVDGVERRFRLSLRSDRNVVGSMRILLDHGAAVDARTTNETFSRTPLHIAAATGNGEVLEALLEAGADIDARTASSLTSAWDSNFERDASTPLHYAAAAGQSDAVRILLDRGADARARTRIRQDSPLHLAAWWGHAGAASLLLSHGASTEQLNDANSLRRAPLHAAAARNHEALVALLLDRGADPNLQINRFLTPLHDAAFNISLNSIRILLDRGASVGVHVFDGYTPLMSAAMSGREDPTRILLEAGASIDARTDEGLTALHAAVAASDMGALRLLLERGANVRAEWLGVTPLAIALVAGRETHVRELEAFGADRRVALGQTPNVYRQPEVWASFLLVSEHGVDISKLADRPSGWRELSTRMRQEAPRDMAQWMTALRRIARELGVEALPADTIRQTIRQPFGGPLIQALDAGARVDRQGSDRQKP